MKALLVSVLLGMFKHYLKNNHGASSHSKVKRCAVVDTSVTIVNAIRDEKKGHEFHVASHP
jgi:hypothetical protein